MVDVGEPDGLTIRKTAEKPTWRHVKRRTASVVLGALGRGGQAKVCQLDSLAPVGDEDVLGLQIPVVDPQLVAVLHGVQDLEEDLAGELILTHVLPPLGDVVEQVTLGAVLQHDVDAVRSVDDLEDRHHVAVARRQVVQPDLPGLEGHLPAVQRRAVGVELAEALDGVPDVGLGVGGRVDDAVRAGPDDPRELQRARDEPP